jgi:shikimate kinase
LRFISGADLGAVPEKAKVDELVALRASNRDLLERVAWLDGRLRTIVERLYSVEQQYSVEHFKLAESLRDLRDERMRLAAAAADRVIILSRAAELQTRIQNLKRRLSAHESVETEVLDDAPVVDDSK